MEGGPGDGFSPDHEKMKKILEHYEGKEGASNRIQSSEHKMRLQMMQQQRLRDPSTKVKRYHFRAIWTPIMMRWWVPLIATMSCSVFLVNQISLESTFEKAQEMEKAGFGRTKRAKLYGGDKADLMGEHLDRVIAGEDPFEVSAELKSRVEASQTLRRGLEKEDDLDEFMAAQALRSSAQVPNRQPVGSVSVFPPDDSVQYATPSSNPFAQFRQQ